MENVSCYDGGTFICGLCRRVRPAPAAGGRCPLHPRWGHFISPDPLKRGALLTWGRKYGECLPLRRHICYLVISAWALRENMGMSRQIIIHTSIDHCKGVWGKGSGPHAGCRGRSRPATGVRGRAAPRITRGKRKGSGPHAGCRGAAAPRGKGKWRVTTNGVQGLAPAKESD
jgi:hypothetical protein